MDLEYRMSGSQTDNTTMRKIALVEARSVEAQLDHRFTQKIARVEARLERSEKQLSQALRSLEEEREENRFCTVRVIKLLLLV